MQDSTLRELIRFIFSLGLCVACIYLATLSGQSFLRFIEIMGAIIFGAVALATLFDL